MKNSWFDWCFKANLVFQWPASNSKPIWKATAFPSLRESLWRMGLRRRWMFQPYKSHLFSMEQKSSWMEVKYEVYHAAQDPRVAHMGKGMTWFSCIGFAADAVWFGMNMLNLLFDRFGEMAVPLHFAPAQCRSTASLWKARQERAGVGLARSLSIITSCPPINSCWGWRRRSQLIFCAGFWRKLLPYIQMVSTGFFRPCNNFFCLVAFTTPSRPVRPWTRTLFTWWFRPWLHACSLNLRTV